MDANWKDKAEKVAAAIESKKRKEQELIYGSRMAEQHQERNRLLSKLAKKYVCCVCGKPCSKPYEWSSPGRDYGVDTSTSGTDWDKPGDMEQCIVCHKWACEDHIHAGVCKNDAEKGILANTTPATTHQSLSKKTVVIIVTVSLVVVTICFCLAALASFLWFGSVT